MFIENLENYLKKSQIRSNSLDTNDESTTHICDAFCDVFVTLFVSLLSSNALSYDSFDLSTVTNKFAFNVYSSKDAFDSIGFSSQFARD